ncbi:hypothetical protein PRZ48_007710 [Zasmidium cellare]|uniref:Uncharacterized protein n=1 Tax=Zasmidium cellare TaxID=395010 RepID=A0ABR0EK24_ZASCE|nr:hypothetical protein PRZ48_007710 [Zasmidium cellare]
MVRLPLYWLSAVTALALAAPHVARQADTYPCTDGVFILAARGADSNMVSPIGVDPNYQDLEGLENIANAVIQHVGKGSYYRALPYAASIQPGVDFVNIGGGVDKAQSIIKDYVSRCKNPRIVLLGYSTGAQVMTSTLIGGQLRGNLDAYKQYITAGALFGDPSFTLGYEPLDAGNSTTTGASARSASDATYFNNNYGSKVRNYCQDKDAACANGGLGDEAVAIHLAAVKVYGQDAINFLNSVIH